MATRAEKSSTQSSIGSRLLHGLTIVDPGRTWVLGVWAAWTVALAVVIGRHEPWRDELQAWAIARDASTPFEVIRIVANEGHPPAWHLLLWVVAQVSRDPALLQFTSLVVGSAAALVTLRFLPLPFSLRCAVLVGYLPLFEWSTISRNYTLAFLLGVATAAILSGPIERRPWAILTALLLAATNILALPLAGGLVLAAAVMGELRTRRPWLLALSLAGAFVAASLVAGYVWSSQKRLPEDFGVGDLIGLPTDALLPLPPDDVYWWGRMALTSGQQAVLGVVLLIVVTALLTVSLPAVLVWLMGTGGYLLLVVAVGVPAETRHVSVIALSLLIAVWIAAADERRRRPVSPIRGYVGLATAGVVLTVSAWAMTRAVREDFSTPFTGAPAAAAWIESNAAGPVAILCASSAPLCSSVALTMDVPAYLTPDGDPFSWVNFTGRQFPGRVEDYAAAVALLEQRTGRDVFVVTIPGWEPEGCVAAFPPMESQTEPMIVCSPADLG